MGLDWRLASYDLRVISYKAMLDLFWLLLPITAILGWWMGNRVCGRRAQQSQSRIIDEYVKGLNYLLEERSDKTIDVFINLVEVDSDTVETHFLLGNLFRRRGEIERAIRIHQNLISRSQLASAQKAGALLELGKDYLRAGLLDRAETTFKELLKTDLYTSEALDYLRRLYEKERDWRSAIEVALRLHRAAGEEHLIIAAHYCCELADEQLSAVDHKSAECYARQALSYDQNNARAEILLGDIAWLQSAASRAMCHYRQAVAYGSHFASLVLPKVQSIIHHAQVTSYDDSHLAIQDEKDTWMQWVRQAELFMHQALRCEYCGFETRRLFWQCPSCQTWETIKPFICAEVMSEPA